MIARVRIAPIEHFCEAYKELRFEKLAGFEVEILTSSMRDCVLGGRGVRHTQPCKVWHLTANTKRKLEELLGHPPFFYDQRGYEVVICEHMLEMD